MSFSVSLIITTYNWMEALDLVLESVFKQTILPDEVIIADDGSTNETRLLINSLKRKFPVPLIHCWQNDFGFRAAMSRNKAIAMARCDYIISIDGDILLHKQFIADHIQAARQNRFVAGKRCLLNKSLTNSILNKLSIFPVFFNSGVINRKNAINSKSLSFLFSKKTNRLRGIKTCNIGFWKKDAIAINGFNESINGWGLEDSEFAIRLMNKGVLCFSIRFKANCFHLFHQQSSRKQFINNQKILQKTIEEKLIWCSDGIDKYL